MKNWIIKKLGGYTELDIEQKIFDRELEITKVGLSGTAFQLHKLLNKK